MLNNLMTVSVATLTGLTGGKISNKFKIPAVAGYVMIGVVLGPSLLGIFNTALLDSVGVVSELALGFIAFVIGAEMRLDTIKELGHGVLLITFLEAFVAFTFVAGSTYLYLHQVHMSLILGAVASATAPAATMMVLRESRAKGPLTTTILAVVAIDDGVALMLYAIASSIAKVMLHPGEQLSWQAMFLQPGIDIFGAIGLGVLIGLVFTIIAKRIHLPSELLILTVGTVLLNSSLAGLWHFSPLLANMAFGTMLANFVPDIANHIFKQVESFTPPIYCMFFVLAGSRLQVGLISKIGWLGLIYLVMRILGKVLGAKLGAVLSDMPDAVRQYIGYGLLSQIGVAVGLSIIVRQDFPASLYGQAGEQMGLWIINILLFTTIFTEIIGPICTRHAVVKAGEAGKA